ncbi:hypothetical protein CTI12_AA385550 [Artemisia annua]|uniref:Uncharacterized protein n=1 Tax=Artemisia annua TaxID=35608 RepID=A0A2U1MFP8_ARTAN|nr:hypothetical protein CTI12_AA385550 [Artemisia annua]
MADHGCWKWLNKWINQFPTITNIPMPHLIPKVPDSTRLWWKLRQMETMKIQVNDWKCTIQEMVATKATNGIWIITRRLIFAAAV